MRMWRNLCVIVRERHRTPECMTDRNFQRLFSLHTPEKVHQEILLPGSCPLQNSLVPGHLCSWWRMPHRGVDADVPTCYFTRPCSRSSPMNASGVMMVMSSYAPRERRSSSRLIRYDACAFSAAAITISSFGSRTMPVRSGRSVTRVKECCSDWQNALTSSSVLYSGSVAGYVDAPRARVRSL